MSKRSQWASGIGFLLATAGAAIGLGNLWKFPYLMGRNGGFVFLITYLVFVAVLGLPVMITEMSIGRYTQRDPIGAFKKLGRHTTFIGIMAVASAFIILSYYSVIGGWILKYIASYITTLNAPVSFSAYTSTAIEPLIWHLVFMLATCLICWKGTSGIEKASTIMMPALFILLIIITIRSLTLPGSAQGLRFVFLPGNTGFSISTINAALGQVFYSLSLAMGITLTYGSYLNRRENIPKNCLRVAVMDTAAALLAGTAIFPAVFAFQQEPAQGPGLIFGTLPKVFEQIPGGPAFAILFFVLMLFAALTSAIALLECVVAYVLDELGWTRTKAVSILGAAIFLLGIPSSLSFGLLGDFKIFNYNFFDFMGMITDNILLPLGGLLMCIYVGWFWGSRHLTEEIEAERNSFPLKRAWICCIRMITPLLIGVVTIGGFIGIYRTVCG